MILFENKYPTMEFDTPKNIKKMVARVGGRKFTQLLWVAMTVAVSFGVVGFLAEMPRLVGIAILVLLVGFLFGYLPVYLLSRQIITLHRLALIGDQLSPPRLLFEETQMVFINPYFEDEDEEEGTERTIVEGRKEISYSQISAVIEMQDRFVLQAGQETFFIRKENFSVGNAEDFRRHIHGVCPGKWRKAAILSPIVVMLCCVAVVLPCVLAYQNIYTLYIHDLLIPSSNFDITTVQPPEGYWVYAGEHYQPDPTAPDFEPYMFIRRCSEIYGYENLSDAQQKAFDLQYGDYFFSRVDEHYYTVPNSKRQLIKTTPYTYGHYYPFNLPEPLTKEEMKAVRELYNQVAYAPYAPLGNSVFDSWAAGLAERLRHFERGCSCDDNRYYHYRTWVYSNATQEGIAAYQQWEQRVGEIVADFGQGLSDLEYARKLVEYLVANTTIVGLLPAVGQEGDLDTYSDPTKVQVGNEIYKVSKLTLEDTILRNIGSHESVAQAFDYLAKELQLPTLVLEGWNIDSGNSKIWNAVRLDDVWYYVDIPLISRNAALKIDYNQYFLCGSQQPPFDRYQVLRVYGEEFLPLPPISETGY